MEEVNKNIKKSSNNKNKVSANVKKSTNKKTTNSKNKYNNVSKKSSITKKKTNSIKSDSISKKISVNSEKKKKENKKNVETEINLNELEIDIKKDIRSHKKFFNISFIITCILLFLFIVAFICLHILIPKIEIIGDSEIIINYNDEYVERGFEASILNIDLTDKVTVVGKVDTSKIGTYEINYFLKEGIYEISKKRIIKVVDKVSPIITLTGGEKVEICQKDNYKELGYKAIDEYDGDITDKVVITNDKDSVVYTVRDSSGNKYSITRKVIKGDSVNPVITLKGKKNLYLGLDNSFTDPGYTGSDNCDGNITNKVTVTGNVQEGVEGTYTLTYTVKDNSNNQTKITRKVIVAERTNPNSGVIKKGAIYLTFDDGPSSVTTGEILDILKEEGVKATFFVTNNGPDYLIKRIYEEGHTIALHTASHDYSKIYSSVDNYFDDLDKVSNRVKRLTGYTSKIVRFPGGSSNTVSKKYSKGIMTELVDNLFGRGYRYYDWNVDSGDASTAKTKSAVYKNVVSNLSKNKTNIVLMHDIKTQTRDALRDIIKYGKDNGYTFEKIDMDTYMVRQKVNN